jgi:hypothetical protein
VGLIDGLQKQWLCVLIGYVLYHERGASILLDLTLSMNFVLCSTGCQIGTCLVRVLGVYVSDALADGGEIVGRW